MCNLLDIDSFFSRHTQDEKGKIELGLCERILAEEVDEFEL